MTTGMSAVLLSMSASPEQVLGTLDNQNIDNIFNIEHT